MWVPCKEGVKLTFFEKSCSTILFQALLMETQPKSPPKTQTSHCFYNTTKKPNRRFAAERARPSSRLISLAWVPSTATTSCGVCGAEPPYCESQPRAKVLISGANLFPYSCLLAARLPEKFNESRRRREKRNLFHHLEEGEIQLCFGGGVGAGEQLKSIPQWNQFDGRYKLLQLPLLLMFLLYFEMSSGWRFPFRF